MHTTDHCVTNQSDKTEEKYDHEVNLESQWSGCSSPEQRAAVQMQMQACVTTTTSPQRHRKGGDGRKSGTARTGLRVAG